MFHFVCVLPYSLGIQTRYYVCMFKLQFTSGKHCLKVSNVKEYSLQIVTYEIGHRLSIINQKKISAMPRVTLV